MLADFNTRALAGSYIKSYLFNPWIVSVSLILGGFVLLWVESLDLDERYKDVEDVPLVKYFLIGLCQCAAMIPGVSRSGASIVSAMLLFVIPMFEGIYKELGGTLPPPTQFLIMVSKFFRTFWWMVAIGIAAVVVIWWPAFGASWFRTTPAPPWQEEVARVAASCKADPGKSERPIFSPYWPPNWGDGLAEPSHPNLPCVIGYSWSG